MKKIGIVTLVDYKNYGNRLQAYAVQKTFKTLGFDSELIKFKKDPYKTPLFIRLKIVAKYILFLKTSLSKTFLVNLRVSNFQKHAKKYLSDSGEYVKHATLDKEFHKQYSFLSVGSDQIWGWFNYDVADFVFLQFAPREKRITFSPSFGSGIVDENYRKIFADGLYGFNYISVREVSGAQIVKELTNKEATVLCDPTMCISKDEWLKFSNIHKKKPRGKFVLTYFLGKKSPKVATMIADISGEFEIIDLNSLESPQFYAITPSEWVDYINNASLFLTDSFHGVVFSIILQTPFAVYSRVGGENMQTRITNILAKFSMENRFEIYSDDDSLFNVDFSNSEEIISNERSKIYAFLKKSMNLSIVNY